MFGVYLDISKDKNLITLKRPRNRRKIMKFEKIEFNGEFDHKKEAIEDFKKIGWDINKDDVDVCLKNGRSIYIHICLDESNILDDGKLPADMLGFDGLYNIKVRISDHTSNVDRFGGFVGGISNQMNFRFFKHLQNTGAIK